MAWSTGHEVPYKDQPQVKVVEPGNFLHVCFQSAPINLLT